MARNRTRRAAPATPTVQHEAGHADVVADGDSVQQVPEGAGEANANNRDGWINGVPASAAEVHQSTLTE